MLDIILILLLVFLVNLIFGYVPIFIAILIFVFCIVLALLIRGHIMKDINNKESGVKMCPNCGYVRKESHVPPQFPENICPSCKTDYRIAVKYVAKVQRPFLSEVFFWLSIISLIAGFYLAYIFYLIRVKLTTMSTTKQPPILGH